MPEQGVSLLACSTMCPILVKFQAPNTGAKKYVFSANHEQ